MGTRSRPAGPRGPCVLGHGLGAVTDPKHNGLKSASAEGLSRLTPGEAPMVTGLFSGLQLWGSRNTEPGLPGLEVCQANKPRWAVGKGIIMTHPRLGVGRKEGEGTE